MTINNYSAAADTKNVQLAINNFIEKYGIGFNPPSRFIGTSCQPAAATLSTESLQPPGRGLDLN